MSLAVTQRTSTLESDTSDTDNTGKMKFSRMDWLEGAINKNLDRFCCDPAMNSV